MYAKTDLSRINHKTSKADLHSALIHYRQKTERLQQINDLYSRIAGVLDLPTMVEAYSIWLGQYVEHALVGFRDLKSDRMHLYCSSHGPQKRDNIKLAEKLLKEETSQTVSDDTSMNSYSWQLNTPSASSKLVFLRRELFFSDEEMNLINDSLEIIAQPLHKSIAYETVFQQARQDSLTGLPNRLVFEERLPSMMEQAKRYNRPLTLAALDLDHFKSVNDFMGHLIGDNVLKNVTDAFKKQIRSSDLLVRMGGDEFLLILPDTSIESARFLSERLCKAVADLNVQAGTHTLGVSIGLKQWSPELDIEQWLEQADDLLYQAKKNGRHQVHVQ